MKTIYNALLEQIEKEVPEIKWIDLDCGQLDTNERPPVAFPACLLNIGIPDIQTIADTIQYCKADITVRLVFDNKGRTANNTNEQEREKSLKIYDTIANVYRALQGFSTENFDALNRTSQGKEKSRHGYFQYRIDFSCEFEDLTAD